MEKTIKFFDFCSGIGGGRIGLERNGFQCVGHSEIDPNTAETYKRFFNEVNCNIKCDIFLKYLIINFV